MMIAADNCCVEVRPSEPGHSLPIHAMMIIQHGIYLLENLELEKLAAAGATEFAFIVQPLKIKGAHRLRGRADRGALNREQLLEIVVPAQAGTIRRVLEERRHRCELSLRRIWVPAARGRPIDQRKRE